LDRPEAQAAAVLPAFAEGRFSRTAALI